MNTLKAIISFNDPILCNRDLLSCSISISINGITGIMKFPSLPVWEVNEVDPLRKSLIAPAEGEISNLTIDWGSPISYPNGISLVKRILMEFKDVNTENIERISEEIYSRIGNWKELFITYITLFTKQRTFNNISVINELSYIDIYLCKYDSNERILNKNVTEVKINLSGEDQFLHLEQLILSADYASNNYLPRKEYELFLGSLKARYKKDYRMAIIEAANALEISLASRISDEFECQNIKFGDKLFKKFRMLGGFFELIKILGITLPDKDYENLIIKPRNSVVHKAYFPDEKTVNRVIDEVEFLLKYFYPIMANIE